MAVILTHKSACEYWLSPYASSNYEPVWMHETNLTLHKRSNYFESKTTLATRNKREFVQTGFVHYESASYMHSEPETIRRNSSKAYSQVDLEKAHLYAHSMSDIISRPLHLMLFYDNNRRFHEEVVFHVCNFRLPPRSFYCIEPGIYVVSPEVCFVQMANELDDLELLRLGYELTAQYVKHSGANSVFRVPVSSQKRLAGIQNSLRGFKGIRKARRVTPYICENAASIREVELAMLLSLPHSWGGFGLPKPKLNVAIEIPQKIKHLFTNDYYVCDLFWDDVSIAIEYDSTQWHTGADRIANDAAKRNALELIGIKVVTVTNRQIKSSTELEVVARLIAKAFGKRLRTSRGYDFRARHTELRNKVLFGRR